MDTSKSAGRLPQRWSPTNTFAFEASPGESFVLKILTCFILIYLTVNSAIHQPSDFPPFNAKNLSALPLRVFLGWYLSLVSTQSNAEAFVNSTSFYVSLMWRERMFPYIESSSLFIWVTKYGWFWDSSAYTILSWITFGSHQSHFIVGSTVWHQMLFLNSGSGLRQ